MLSIEQLIINAVAFVRRFLYTFAVIVFRPFELIRKIKLDEITHHTQNRSQKIKSRLTNPHVFFIVSQILTVAAFSTLTGLQGSVSPVSFWELHSGRFIYEFSNQLLETNFFRSLLYSIPIAFFFYVLFYLIGFVLTRNGKNRVLFNYFFLYWFGASLAAYIVICFLLPNVLGQFLSYEVENRIVMTLYYFKRFYFLIVPVVWFVQESYLTMLKYFVIGIVCAWSIEYYIKMYSYATVAIAKDRSNEIFVRNLEVENGSDLCVAVHYSKDSVDLLLRAVLVNNSDVPIYVDNRFGFQVNDNTDSIPQIVFRESENHATDNTYKRVDPKTLLELVLLSRLDSINTKKLHRMSLTPFGTSHYTINYSYIVEGEMIRSRQNININCNGGGSFYKHKH